MTRAEQVRQASERAAAFYRSQVGAEVTKGGDCRLYVATLASRADVEVDPDVALALADWIIRMFRESA